MPKCYRCHASIIFVKTIDNWRFKLSERPVPVDVSPSPAGTFSLFQWPVLFKGQRPADGSLPETVARRQGGEALAFLQRRGVPLYSIHFETCTNRNNGN